MARDLAKTLWTAADKLHSSMDAAEYKHTVLGLIFLKYISDAFDQRREELRSAFVDPESDLYLEDLVDREEVEEERDYYTTANVFWVPEAARWETIRAQAKQPDIGTLIDKALEAIEAKNPRLKGILDKRYGWAQLEPGRLGELVDLISTIGLGSGQKAEDILGQVYECFLGHFANAEGKKSGQFYTPASVVRVLVAVLAPHKGKVYDPCPGSGGMFMQSERFIEAHGRRYGDISIYGQESNPTTWRLAAMNLAIRGLDFNFGEEPADTFHRDQDPDLKADYILANPPFTMSDWGGERLADDKRWVYGTPPPSNANYA
jgi:type I restriction enzyme M protein